MKLRITGTKEELHSLALGKLSHASGGEIRVVEKLECDVEPVEMLKQPRDSEVWKESPPELKSTRKYTKWDKNMVETRVRRVIDQEFESMAAFWAAVKGYPQTAKQIAELNLILAETGLIPKIGAKKLTAEELEELKKKEKDLVLEAIPSVMGEGEWLTTTQLAAKVKALNLELEREFKESFDSALETLVDEKKIAVYACGRQKAYRIN